MIKNLRMKKYLPLMLASLVTVTGLTGCSSSSDNTTSEETQVEGTVADSSEGTSTTVEVFNGTLETPESTDNFVALELAYMDHLEALGVLPTAAIKPNGITEESTPAQIVAWEDGFGRLYPNGEVDDVEALNSNDNPNIERLLMIEPDFIIAGDNQEEYLSQLEAVAPTYLMDSTLNLDDEGFRDWKATHRKMGEITGTEEVAEQNIADYDAMVADFVAQIGDDIEGKVAMVCQIDTKGIQYATKVNYAHIYRDLGFETPDNIPVEARETIAVENLVDINPDYIFATIESYEDFEVLEASPIWQNLDAVKNGNVFEFAHYAWNRTNGPNSNTLMFEETANFLLTGEQTSQRFNLED